jgi:acyl-CoA thioester hydrolase
MPAIFKRTFRIRQYECDAYGHVNHAHYLRYMQEAALDASAAVGYDEAKYAELGTLWLIRETDVEYLHSLRYGDSVEVTTWVGDFRRVRSRRFYELRHTATGELYARANTDWVYLDRALGKPISVPPEMIAAFAPEGDVPDAPPREHFPVAPPPPPGMFTMRRIVEWRDVDAAGHVNNATYLNYMEECGIQHARSANWEVSRMRAEGFAIVARRHRIEYRLQAALGEELTVSTYLSDVRRTSATRHYIIARAEDGALIAQARSQWVFVNIQTGGVMRLNPDYLRDFAASIAEE